MQAELGSDGLVCTSGQKYAQSTMVSPTKRKAVSKPGKEHIFFKFMHRLLLSLYILLSSIYTYRCVWGDGACVVVCLRVCACVYVFMVTNMQRLLHSLTQSE